ncbi:hypothetical protein [Chromobacterium vaccinii]|uniref:DUF7946 domain-containing protein n=1 Tax=Chromobacterium vaccinii TaxID=1108595 RepID=UPI0032614A40
MEVVDFPVTYDGRDAEMHKIDLYALGGSIQGVARILAVSAHFAVTGGEYAKQFGTHQVKVYAQEPAAKCFELGTVIEFVKQQQILSGAIGAVITGVVSYVISKASGNREEMKLLSERLEQAIKELGNRDQKVIDRMLSTIEKMADSLRPAVRSAVEPVGVECDTLTIGRKTDPCRVVIDKATRDAILADDTSRITQLNRWEVVFTELDRESSTGKVRLVSDDSNVRIRAEVNDPTFMLPDNKYLQSYARELPVIVIAKALIKDGELDRLYVSDAE